MHTCNIDDLYFSLWIFRLYIISISRLFQIICVMGFCESITVYHHNHDVLGVRKQWFTIDNLLQWSLWKHIRAALKNCRLLKCAGLLMPSNCHLDHENYVLPTQTKEACWLMQYWSDIFQQKAVIVHVIIHLLLTHVWQTHVVAVTWCPNQCLFKIPMMSHPWETSVTPFASHTDSFGATVCVSAWQWCSCMHVYLCVRMKKQAGRLKRERDEKSLGWKEGV